MKSKTNWAAILPTIIALALMYKDVVTTPLAKILLGMVAVIIPMATKLLSKSSGTISSNGIDLTGGIYLVNFAALVVYIIDLIHAEPLWGGLQWPVIASATLTVIIRTFLADSPENIQADIRK